VNAGGRSLRHASVALGGQSITGAIVSFTVIVWRQLPIFPQESSIEYVLDIILGQLPLSVCVTAKLDCTIPQLSASHPFAIKSPKVSVEGTSALHSTSRAGGQVIKGAIVSTTDMT
jgi:hypothetical protein